MLRKISVLVMLMLLGGCAWFNGSTQEEMEYTGSAKSDAVNGSYKIVEVTIQGDKITKVSMDETNAMSFDGSRSGTKKELGSDYNMKAYSDIGKEWNEQIKALEDYIVKNGIEKVQIDDDGKPIVDDLKTSCTINVEEFVELTQSAINDAKSNK